MNNGYQNMYTRSTLNGIYNNNFLNMNNNKKADIYVSFANSKEWQDMIFKGYIIDTNNDYILIKDINSNKTIYLKRSYIDYIIFDN